LHPRRNGQRHFRRLYGGRRLSFLQKENSDAQDSFSGSLVFAWIALVAKSLVDRWADALGGRDKIAARSLVASDPDREMQAT
jgi:hypothetical protein